MSEPKMTAEERVAAEVCRISIQYGDDEEIIYPEDAIRIAEEHAAAAVEGLEARVAELESLLQDVVRDTGIEYRDNRCPALVAADWFQRRQAALGKEAQP